MNVQLKATIWPLARKKRQASQFMASDFDEES